MIRHKWTRHATEEERIAANKESKRRYDASAKGKATQRSYRATAKGKAAVSASGRKRYLKKVTEAGGTLRKTYDTELERMEARLVYGLNYRQTARGKATSRASSLKYLKTERGKKRQKATRRARYLRSKVGVEKKNTSHKVGRVREGLLL